jgi:hypothetical protein
LPEQCSKAIDLIQEQEGQLDDEQLVALIDIFQQNTGAADAYMTLKHDTLRKIWIQKRLVKLGFPKPSEVQV